MFRVHPSTRGRSHLIAGCVVIIAGALSTQASAASRQIRSVVIPGYERSIAGVGNGLDPAPLHVSPAPYERNNNIGYYRNLIARSYSSPIPQRIAGTCAEACTMRLGIRGACVERSAELWFLPALSSDGIVRRNDTRAMFSAYPGAIARWAARATNANAQFDPIRYDTGVFSPSYGLNAYGPVRGPNYAVLTGSQAIALGAHGCS